MPAVRFLSEDVWVSGVSDKGMAHNIAVQSSKAGGTGAHPLASACCAHNQSLSNDRLAPVRPNKTANTANTRKSAAVAHGTELAPSDNTVTTRRLLGDVQFGGAAVRDGTPLLRERRLSRLVT